MTTPRWFETIRRKNDEARNDDAFYIGRSLRPIESKHGLVEMRIRIDRTMRYNRQTLTLGCSRRVKLGLGNRFPCDPARRSRGGWAAVKETLSKFEPKFLADLRFGRRFNAFGERVNI